MKAIEEKDIPGGFSPIQDLKPGDKVRAKSERHNAYKTCRDGIVMVVHRVRDFRPIQEAGKPVRMDDFTVLFDDETNEASFVELSFDSRRFERVN